MTEKNKPVIRKKVHACSKEEMIDRIELVLFGNGHPEEGLAFMFRSSVKDVEIIKDRTVDINDSIKKLAIMYDDTFEAATTAASALEKYTTGIKNFKDGEKDAEEKKKIADELKERLKKEVEDRDLIIANLKMTKKRDHWQRVSWIVMAVIAILSLWGGLYFGFEKINKGQMTIQSNVDNLGTPYVTNPRGVIVDSVNVKMWPKDFTNDSIK